MKFVSPATNAIPVLAVDDHAMFREAGWHCYTTPPSPSMAEVEIRKMRMVTYPGSPHFPNLAEQRRDVFKEIMDWLTKYNP